MYTEIYQMQENAVATILGNWPNANHHASSSSRWGSLQSHDIVYSHGFIQYIVIFYFQSQHSIDKYYLFSLCFRIEDFQKVDTKNIWSGAQDPQDFADMNVALDDLIPSIIFLFNFSEYM